MNKYKNTKRVVALVTLVLITFFIPTGVFAGTYSRTPTGDVPRGTEVQFYFSGFQRCVLYKAYPNIPQFDNEPCVDTTYTFTESGEYFIHALDGGWEEYDRWTVTTVMDSSSFSLIPSQMTGSVGNFVTDNIGWIMSILGTLIGLGTIVRVLKRHIGKKI